MMRFLVSLVGLSLCLSCQQKKEISPEESKPDASKEGSRFEMYQMSEMAMLMEQMFADNQRLKEEIEQGKTLGEMPDHFRKIHSAAMTDPSENDDFFKEKAEVFLVSQQKIYSDSANAKEHFNASVKACIDCHQVKCVGPIARIKKLYIK